MAFQAPGLALRPAVSQTSVQMSGVYERAMEQWKAENPWMAQYGFGPSVKAERWNGRHAMFGCASGEAHAWRTLCPKQRGTPAPCAICGARGDAFCIWVGRAGG